MTNAISVLEGYLLEDDEVLQLAAEVNAMAERTKPLEEEAALGEKAGGDAIAQPLKGVEPSQGDAQREPAPQATGEATPVAATAKSSAAATSEADLLAEKRAAILASIAEAKARQLEAEKAAGKQQERKAMLEDFLGDDEAERTRKAMMHKMEQTHGQIKIKDTRLQENFGQTKFIKP
mmetsp:Transcript_26412/g.60330  ORF Transcript_26412/g.60330 Transcript_26412/m.60330 type:complete len:178 (-) Transcript_26412:599-1132(-)